AHRVAAARHARAERSVVGGVALGHGALLLRLIALLLLLLFLRPAGPTHQAEDAPDPRTDCGALTGVATDGPPDRTQRRAARRAPEQSALRSASLRRGRCVDLGVRGIEAALLHGPAVALALVELLLLGALAPRWIDEYLSRGQARNGHNEHGERERCALS